MRGQAMTTDVRVRTLGRFRIEGQFRNDGPGRLYHGLSDTGQPVVLNVIPAALAKHAVAAADRGLRPVDLGSLENGDIYLVYDIPSGETLSRCFERGPMTWIDVVSAFGPTFEALARLHAQGRAYGEIAPTRMVLRPSHGVALIGRELKQLSTAFNRRSDASWPSTDVVPYLSPERARGAGPMPAADVFAMAAVIYEAITGFRPFEAKGLLELLFQIQTADVCALGDYDPTIPRALSDLVASALDKDPARRPTAQEMADGLRHVTASPKESEKVILKAEAHPGQDVVLPNPAAWTTQPAMQIPVLKKKVAEEPLDLPTGPVEELQSASHVQAPSLIPPVTERPFETPADDVATTATHEIAAAATIVDSLPPPVPDKQPDPEPAPRAPSVSTVEEALAYANAVLAASAPAASGPSDISFSLDSLPELETVPAEARHEDAQPPVEVAAPEATHVAPPVPAPVEASQPEITEANSVAAAAASPLPEIPLEAPALPPAPAMEGAELPAPLPEAMFVPAEVPSDFAPVAMEPMFSAYKKSKGLSRETLMILVPVGILAAIGIFLGIAFSGGSSKAAHENKDDARAASTDSTAASQTAPAPTAATNPSPTSSPAAAPAGEPSNTPAAAQPATPSAAPAATSPAPKPAAAAPAPAAKKAHAAKHDRHAAHHKAVASRRGAADEAFASDDPAPEAAAPAAEAKTAAPTADAKAPAAPPAETKASAPETKAPAAEAAAPQKAAESAPAKSDTAKP